ncbi:MAG TPA: arylsulfotransferase family protein [Solirubrobacteraceae bacterium]|nr:arylsulfotransferase family protein [Solirubrobacteraceae bacterium]
MRLRNRILGLGAALAGVAAVALTVLAVTGRGSENQMVSVFPIPGGRVAAPQTQISFRGVMSGHLGRVIVTGSRTGRHTGRVVAHSDGQGASFLPAKPFAAGEMVTVKTGLQIPGTRAGTFHFSIAHPAGAIPVQPLDLAPRVAGDEFTFQSRPDLTPPAVEVTKQSENAAAGDIFITPQQGPTQNGVMILNGQGALVWFQPIKPPNIAADLRVQHYQGKPVLTWWQGYSGAGVGAGEDVIYDSSYRQVAVVHAGNGLTADLHEFRLSSQDTALITAFYPVFWNASALHGSTQQVVLDSVVQEIDIKTGLVLYQWDSLDHVPLTDTYEAMPKSGHGPFDYFHINSVQEQRSGDLLISARNTWAAYDIDHQTGAIMWTLGGRKSSYKLTSGAVFAFQHDVRLHTDTDPTVTLFDDGGGPPRVHTESRAITVRLDSSGKTATLVSANQHSPALAAAFEGNVQALPGGDQFVGWGQQPYFSEYNAKGQMMFDARFVDSNSSYRAYRFPWVGTPTGGPSVTITSQGTTANVYVSWNGATRVASWRVLAGSAPNALQAVVTSSKQGFESQIAIATQPYVAVQALDAAGHTLGTSSVVHVT